jgi:hypothetical protein
MTADVSLSQRNPHILSISPPLNLEPRWFKDHLASTISKYEMSLCVLGMAEEWRIAASRSAARQVGQLGSRLIDSR